ncbi:unnamed protein product, partial [Didymodactylos carnosus]
KYYEETYQQGRIRIKSFENYAEKLVQRFPDLKTGIMTKMKTLHAQWHDLELAILSYLDEDFDKILN